MNLGWRGLSGCGCKPDAGSGHCWGVFLAGGGLGIGSGDSRAIGRIPASNNSLARLTDPFRADWAPGRLAPGPGYPGGCELIGPGLVDRQLFKLDSLEVCLNGRGKTGRFENSGSIKQNTGRDQGSTS